MWGIAEHASWDGIKEIWGKWIPSPWRDAIVGIVSGFFQWLASGSWLTIFGVAAFGMFLVNQVDMWREHRRQRQLSLPPPKEYQEDDDGTQRKVESSLGDFTIDYAGYGLGPGQYHNVTDRVRSLVKDGKLEIPAGSESLQCEVYSGALGKHLLVIYSHGENEGLCKKTAVYQRMILP